MYNNYDYSKLRGAIKEKYKTQNMFAKKLKIGRVSLSQKLNGKIGFTQEQITNSCELLGIELENVYEYFFMLKVQKNE